MLLGHGGTIGKGGSLYNSIIFYFQFFLNKFFVMHFLQDPLKIHFLGKIMKEFIADT